MKLSEKYSHIRLLLVGGEEENLDPLLPITKKHLVNHPHIKSVGIQEDIRPYLDLMDIFTFPSYREGFGVSIMEAASMGIPAISSDITGCNEIIKDRHNGIVIPVKNQQSLYKAMLKIIENKSLYELLQKNSRTSVTTNYERMNMWQLLLEEYRNLETNL